MRLPLNIAIIVELALKNPISTYIEKGSIALIEIRSAL